MIKDASNYGRKFGQENETKERIEAELKHNYRFQPGQKIDEFTVLKHLGFGGFAEVYHCKDELNREVAIKILTKQKANLKEEALVAAKLDHPNIVFVIGLAQLKSDNTPVIVYKYIY